MEPPQQDEAVAAWYAGRYRQLEWLAMDSAFTVAATFRRGPAAAAAGCA